MRREVPKWVVVAAAATLLLAAAAILAAATRASGPPPRALSFCRSATYGDGGRPTERLGLFVHYGPSSLVNETDTLRWWRKMVKPSYARTVARFRPADSAAVDGWFDLAKQAGASYVMVTAKHHDGYTLWDSETTSYGVGRNDIIADSAKAARRSGLGLGLYFSMIDVSVRSYQHDWPAYLRLVRAQMRELLTRYGRIEAVWLDGPGWATGRSPDEWGLPALYDEIHRLQPGAEIVTNHHCGRPLAGETTATFEERLPKLRRPWPTQSAYTLSGQWYYSTREAAWPHRRYVALRARARKVGAGLLVNVAPRPDGTFAPSYVRALLGP